MKQYIIIVAKLMNIKNIKFYKLQVVFLSHNEQNLNTMGEKRNINPIWGFHLLS